MIFADPFAHGSYLLWDGGSIKFDTCDEDEIVHAADIVEHPVEVGADITDHYNPKSRDVKLTCFITQEPVDPSLYPDAQGALANVEIALPPFPKPSLATQITTGIAGGGIATLITQAIAKSPPTSLTQRALVYQNPIDTVASVLNTILDDLRANAVLVDVATKSRYYAQHLIANVTTRQNEKTGAGIAIEISLHQVQFVSTDTVAAPPTPKKKKDKKPKDKGKQNPTTPKLTSLAAKVLDLASGKSSSPGWYGPPLTAF